MSDKNEKNGKDRGEREYPHGSGDRNAWSPFGKKRVPEHRGGTQREPVDDPPVRRPGKPADRT